MTELRTTWAILLLLSATGCDQIQSAVDSARGTKPPTASIQADSPREFIGRAIAACGGEQNIARLKKGRVEMVGRGGFAPGVSGQFTIIDTFDLPQRLRREATFSDGKLVLKMLTVIDGHRGWMKSIEGTSGGEVRELAPDADKNNAFPHSVLGGLIEMREPDVELKRLVADRPDQTWIAVRRDGQALGTNVFDNRTGHLLSSHKQLVDATAGPVAIHTVYSDYHNISGVEVPLQMASFRESEMLVELKVVKLDVLPVVDPRLFARPE